MYIGALRFGARAAVGNSVDDIRRLCDYGHLFGAKVYVTVNTIIYDDELEATRQLLSELQEAGVDAVLVQDMALLSMSQLPLHASTQTDNRTPGKVRWLRAQGFQRAVLARELSLEEIGAIHREVPDMELEVFVHGALCVSYSGICYASQHCFGRSANRGACAQFCRMPFSLVDADGKEVEHERYLLSLKDLNQSEHLLELAEAGATSFKIEGRLKDISYVKNVTAAYSQELNKIISRYPDKYCRSSLGVCSYTFTPDLRKTFNRGYTTYFLHGRQPEIASFDTPKAVGEYVGTVKELRPDSFNVAGVASFANGDGLCFYDGRRLEGFRANRVVGNRIYPYRMPRGLMAGMRLYRNNDQEFERLLVKPSAERRIPIRISLRAVADGFELTAAVVSQQTVAEPLTVHFTAAHQEAQKPPRENIIRQLSKLGDTIYTCAGIEVAEDFGFFIPNSLLAEMRRTLTDQLQRRGLMGQGLLRGAGVRSAGEVTAVGAPPKYAYPYLYNIANRLSQAFYGADGETAYELKGGEGPVMQCRHCIRYSLGYCVRRGGKRPTWREPLSLRLGDGRSFRLAFDCENCQMAVYGMTIIEHRGSEAQRL